MTLKHTILTLILSLSAITVAGQKKSGEPLYAFGWATCLGDSTIYLSAISKVEGAEYADKSRFLERRDEYARQFEATLLSRYGRHFTCALFYARKRSKAEKNFLKLRMRLKKQKGFKVEEIPASEFSFQTLKAEE